INRANAVINADLELSADLQTRADQLVGEALALRALAHFDVCRIYAQHYGFTDDASHPGVPIVTQFEEGAEPTRSTVAQVYAAVIADMEAALTKMSEHKGTAFMSPIAVKALLTRIYFYQEEYQRVESLATEVIDSDETSLTATEGYVAAWLEAGSPPDVIFEVVMNENDNNGSDALGRMYINEGYGDYLPSDDLRLIIETDDLRSQLFEPDSTVGGGTFGWDRVNKYPATIGDDNTPVIRLAEIYLMRAEARARNGSAGAVDDLMTIRRRAWPDAPDVTATGDDLIEEIILERRIELAFEGNRLWDQMRLKRGIERTDCTAPICEISYPNDRFILPIPSQEIDANPNMTQNVGY
ncbi:MAG: RagB/SusD family nutrient uptake outer membrane protein, partial [Bacteroidota bacterium]